MSDELALFGLLLILYLAEFIYWLPSESIALRTFGGFRWRLVKPGKFLGNSRGSLLFASPLPTVGATFFVPLTSDEPADEPKSRITSIKQINETIEALEQRLFPLRFLASLLLFHLFAFSPLLIMRYSLDGSWVPILTGVLCLQALMALFYILTIAPDDQTGAFGVTFKALIIMIFPPTALEAWSSRTRDSLANYHPLATAATLLPENKLKEYARKQLLELKYPTATESSSAEKIANAEIVTMKKILSEAKISFENLLAPPTQTSDESQSYCPRCETQYQIKSGECSDCPGISLKRF